MVSRQQAEEWARRHALGPDLQGVRILAVRHHAADDVVAIPADLRVGLGRIAQAAGIDGGRLARGRGLMLPIDPAGAACAAAARKPV